MDKAVIALEQNLIPSKEGLEPLLKLTETASSTKSHFRSAFFLIPSRERRQALDDFYRYCRIVDDLADEEDLLLSTGQRLILLQQIEEWLKAPYDFGSSFWNRFQEQIRFHNYPIGSLVGVIEGVRMDMGEQALRFETWEDLNRYVHGVAGCVGEVILTILGYSGPEAKKYAENLGRHVQYLNIMRDLEEDRSLGRVYVPQEFIRQTGLEWNDALKTKIRDELYSRASLFRQQALALDIRCLACEALVGIYTYAAKKYWRFGDSRRLSKPERLFAVVQSSIGFWFH